MMKSKFLNIDLYKPRHYRLRILEVSEGLMTAFLKTKIVVLFFEKRLK
jgi:hypothetical protein